MNAGISSKPKPGSATDAVPALAVGGLTPLTTTDYPGCLAAVVFCQGCPWRCAYCHNPHLIPRQGENTLPWEEVAAFLGRRRGLLDAVVFSGGEPTLQAGLGEAMELAREMGFRVGLHTAGMYPERLEQLLPWLDWVGFDVKAPLAGYQRITRSGGGDAARESLRLLLARGVDTECRTTCHSSLLGNEDLLRMAGELAELGVKRWVLQVFRPQGCADQELVGMRTAVPDAALVGRLSALIQKVEVRAA